MKLDDSLAPQRAGVALILAAALGAALSGCVPLVVGTAAVGTAMVVTDRRTSGIQLEDEGIELRANNRIRDALGDSGHVNVISYNRMVLLTGEVPSAQVKQRIGEVAAQVENVKSVVNETVVDVPSSLGQRSADTLTTGRVKAALIDTRNIQSRVFKVLTERGVVYLMGVVTQREADLATEVARNVSGVQKVVRVFQVVTEAELARAQSAQSGTAPPPAPPPAAPASPPPPPIPAPVVPSAQPIPVR